MSVGRSDVSPEELESGRRSCLAVGAHGLHHKLYGQVGVKPGELAAHGLKSLPYA
jgi:hypothetical protein